MNEPSLHGIDGPELMRLVLDDIDRDVEDLRQRMEPSRPHPGD